MSAEPMKPLVAESEVLPPIIIKKITVAGHGGHHGGAWKVAYADFVTAMMAFFLLLWIVGATNEDQRKGIADYFSPTLVQHTKAGGSNGVMGGRAMMAPDGNAPQAVPAGSQRVLRSEEHTSELQSLMRISYAVFCLKKKIQNITS